MPHAELVDQRRSVGLVKEVYILLGLAILVLTLFAGIFIYVVALQ